MIASVERPVEIQHFGAVIPRGMLPRNHRVHPSRGFSDKLLSNYRVHAIGVILIVPDQQNQNTRRKTASGGRVDSARKTTDDMKAM